MAKDDTKLSTRQRQLREQEEAAGAHGGPSVLAVAERAQDGEGAPAFVVPGAGGQTPGEVEDEPRVAADLVVRRSQSVAAADQAGAPVEDNAEHRGTPEQRGDTEPGTTDKASGKGDGGK